MKTVALLGITGLWIAVFVLKELARQGVDDDRALRVHLRGQNRIKQARIVVRYMTGL